ncbi:MAG: NAD-dependent epimerase/dehydratase family protein [Candidatus Neomarinimicrobiota bacterium]
MKYSSNQMQKVLILGSSGFIGSALIEEMYSKDFQISTVLRDFSKCGFISRFKKVEKKYFDPSNTTLLKKLITENDIIINCIHDFGNQKFNISLIKTICESIINEDKKLIHISTISTYQPFINNQTINESTLFQNKTFQYAKNKNEIDEIIVGYQTKEKIQATIIQPTIVYGKYSKPWTEKIINQLSNGKMVIPSDSGNCNLIHVKDLCNGIIKSIPKEYNNEKIIISNPEKISWIEFFEFFDSLFKDNRIIYQDSKLINKNLSNPLKLIKVILGDPKKAFMWEPMKSFLMQLKNKLTPKMKNLIKEVYSVYKKFSPLPVYFPDEMLMDVYLDNSNLNLNKMQKKLNFYPQINFEEGKKMIKLYYDISYKPYIDE